MTPAGPTPPIADPLPAHCRGASKVLDTDGGADSAMVLAEPWAEWMRRAAATSRGSALATVPPHPYPRQVSAVYEIMLPQVALRFLLVDEPGTARRSWPGCACARLSASGTSRSRSSCRRRTS